MINQVIAIDPGIKKCGLILVSLDDDLVLEARIVQSEDVIDLVEYWCSEYLLQGIILGNGTSSKYWQELLAKLAPVKLVEEKGTTLRARQRYWEIWPPANLLRLLPRGLIIPPDDLDAVAALVLLEDYLQRKLKWIGPPTFKNVL